MSFFFVVFFMGDNVAHQVGGEDREKKRGNGERGSGFVLWFCQLAGIS